MLALRLAKIASVAAITLYMALAVFENVTDYWTNHQFVSHLMSMDQLPQGSAIRWRAMTSPIVHHAAYVLIIGLEVVITLLCGAGMTAMFLQLQTGAQSFHNAKWLAVAGLALGFFLFEGGFIAIGGEWFGVWRIAGGNSLDSAFRVAATMLGVLIFISSRDEELF
jgi:predicted small integral membrane protein